MVIEHTSWLETMQELTYDGMDGMYAKLLDMKWNILNATWKVERQEWWYFIFVS